MADMDWLGLMQGLTVAHCESRGIEVSCGGTCAGRHGIGEQALAFPSAHTGEETQASQSAGIELAGQPVSVSSSGGGNASFPGPSPREIECLVYGPDTLQERVIMAEVRRCEQLVYKENVNAD